MENLKLWKLIMVCWYFMCCSYFFIKTFIGGEFTGLIAFFKEQGITLRFKRPPRKAVYAEGQIWHLKQKIYMSMRHNGDPNWEKYLQPVTQAFNSAQHQSIGYLCPKDLTSPEKAVAIDIANNFSNIPRYHESFFEERDERKNASDLRKGDFVYMAIPTKPTLRGYHVQVRKTRLYFLHPKRCDWKLRIKIPICARAKKLKISVHSMVWIRISIFLLTWQTEKSGSLHSSAWKVKSAQEVRTKISVL